MSNRSEEFHEEGGGGREGRREGEVRVRMTVPQARRRAQWHKDCTTDKLRAVGVKGQLWKVNQLGCGEPKATNHGGGGT